LIAVVNRSTSASDSEVRLATRACATQLRRDCAPAWGLKPVPVGFFARSALLPRDAWVIYVLDDTDQQDWLGWHSADDRGVPFARVFARTIAQNRWYLSVTLSHEILEASCNQLVNDYIGGYAKEVSDPCEADFYTIQVRVGDEDDERRRAVKVSDFVYPAWFDRSAKGPYDHLHHTAGPFQLARGGYAVTTSGTRWGTDVAEWRKWMKIADGSRTLRMVAQGAPESQELRNELAALDRAA
jgi:hypothetical protein